MIFFTFFAIASCIMLTTSRALILPENVKHDAALLSPEDFTRLHRRQDAPCGGYSNLEQCGGSFPSDFCCSVGTSCMALNTSSSITAALCCPAGQDCSSINPIDCSQGLQNATQSPQSQLHSSPTVPLQQCGNQCCPMGYACQGSVCVAQSARQAATSSASSSSTATPSAVSTDAAGVKEITQDSDSSGVFSGKSFAAGFVPGLVLGGLIVAALMFLCLKRKRYHDAAQKPNEKLSSAGRDTLTDLGPYMARRPTVHGRSISEPTANMMMGHRTEFLNSASPQQKAPVALNGYVASVNIPVTPKSAGQNRQGEGLSHSPFQNYASSPLPAQLPLPTHMKRGTLSFQISPVRALRKQRSMHSLRRHMTNNTQRSTSAASRGQRTTRSESGETIQVLMSTPESSQQSPFDRSGSAKYHSHSAIASRNASSYGTRAAPNRHWPVTTEDECTPTATLNQRSPSPVRHRNQTPTRPGKNSDISHIGASLQRLSSPRNYPVCSDGHRAIPTLSASDEQGRKPDSLWPPTAAQAGSEGDSKWRLTAATTFEGMMEKAGWRRSQMCMGPDPREWNR